MMILAWVRCHPIFRRALAIGVILFKPYKTLTGIPDVFEQPRWLFTGTLRWMRHEIYV
jgi:hypothetical protein